MVCVEQMIRLATVISLIIVCYSDKQCGPKQYLFNNQTCAPCTEISSRHQIILIPCNRTSDAVLACEDGFRKCPIYATTNDFICERLSPTSKLRTTTPYNETVCPNRTTSGAPETTTEVKVGDEGKTNIELIVGLIIGGFVLLVIIILVAIYCYKTKCKCAEKNNQNDTTTVEYSINTEEIKRLSPQNGVNQGG